MERAINILQSTKKQWIERIEDKVFNVLGNTPNGNRIEFNETLFSNDDTYMTGLQVDDNGDVVTILEGCDLLDLIDLSAETIALMLDILDDNAFEVVEE